MQASPRPSAVKPLPRTGSRRAEATLRGRAPGDKIDFPAVREERSHEHVEIESKIGIWTRLMDTVMGWLFVLGLFVWAHVMRSRSTTGGEGLKDQDDHPQLKH